MDLSLKLLSQYFPWVGMDRGAKSKTSAILVHRTTLTLPELDNILTLNYLSWFNRGGPTKLKSTFFQMAKLRFFEYFCAFLIKFQNFQKILRVV